jgi:hypothetical protein
MAERAMPYKYVKMKGSSESPAFFLTSQEILSHKSDISTAMPRF